MPFDAWLDYLLTFNSAIRDLPPWMINLALAMITLAIFYISRRFFLSILERRLHAFVRRFGLGSTGELVVDALMLPARLLLIALALFIAQRIVVPTPDTDDIITHVTRSIVFVSAFVAGYRLVDILSFNNGRVTDILGFNIEDRLLPIIRTVVKLALFVVAVFVVMGEWSIDVSGLLASLGIVGLAFSLAAQDTVSNLFGFSTIIGDRPFMVGEYIVSGEIEGVVEKVGIRSTRIRKPDRGIVTVPNNILATAPVERLLRRRIQFTLGVTYDTTADQMEALLARMRTMLRDRDHIIDHSVAVYFTDFGASSLDILVLCEVTIRDWHALLSEREAVNLAVMRLVREMGLSVAFPTRTVHVEGLERSQDVFNDNR